MSIVAVNATRYCVYTSRDIRFCQCHQSHDRSQSIAYSYCKNYITTTDFAIEFHFNSVIKISQGLMSLSYHLRGLIYANCQLFSSFLVLSAFFHCMFLYITHIFNLHFSLICVFFLSPIFYVLMVLPLFFLAVRYFKTCVSLIFLIIYYKLNFFFKFSPIFCCICISLSGLH